MDFGKAPKPPSKKGKTDDDISSVIARLSQLINTRSDTIEKMVSENAQKIEGLKKNSGLCMYRNK